MAKLVSQLNRLPTLTRRVELGGAGGGKKLVEDSPAGRAGLQVGDELLFVNRNQAIALGIGEICRLFQGGEGKKINVLARRNGQLFSAHFTLKRLI